MSRIARRFFPAGLSLVASFSAALAQELSQDDAILVVAAQHVPGQVQGTRVAIDPPARSTSSIPRSGTYAGVRDTARTRMIAERLGALVQSKQIVFRCSDSAGPPRCPLGDLDAVIVLSDPLLTGDTPSFTSRSPGGSTLRCRGPLPRRT